jgi:hypothetical protein
MKPLMIFVAVLAFLPLHAFDANAKSYHRYAKRPLGHVPTNVAPTSRYRQTEGWYVHDPEKLPFGSSLWWEEMVREGRARRGN